MRQRRRISLLILLLTSSNLFAEVNISVKDRVVNRTDLGYCSFCCLETLGRHLGVVKLYDLVEKRTKEPLYISVENGSGQLERVKRNQGTQWAVLRKLQALRVKFKIQLEGNFDTKLIKSSLAKDLGCLVVLDEGAFGEKPHAIVLLDFNDNSVLFFDPNDIESNFRAKRSWFNKYWTGHVVVIEP